MVKSIQNDTEIWQLVKEGDRAAFDQLYHQYASPVFAMVYKHLRNRSDAQDITQEVFLDIWEKRNAITIQSSLFNYLYTTARNRMLRYIRQNAFRPESLDFLRQLLDEQHLPQTYQDSYPESAIRSIESSIVDEIAGLPEQMKKVYRLSTETGMSIPEIANHLLISPYTVKNHLSKVRKRLRQTVSRLSSLFFALFVLLLITARLLSF
ncbi:MAG: sigma-70 family RNA polymerase sigma factor [Candidatus Pseudobacter hemicellulosilyticus]|uniref:Sigma-70 family RNA polymerase sigma factor n=1 Tax=Candidatus Pseudobacter hemicellulosilyticus TaxID=3121375 RepID=A0AAJ5WU17_9BACT|nr:MAG: sigma-70 family RNA polymerase sigma factor [Pseudobacter sp.]